VQSTAAGLAMFCGGALRDAISSLSASGLLGPALASPSTSYSVVYHVEMLLLFFTLVAIGPLVQRNTRFTPPVSPPLGQPTLSA
jgi:BCD family chlorophyll transporter-like MFS transporter